MDNQNTYVVFIDQVDHINNLKTAQDNAFQGAVVNFELDVWNKDDFECANWWANEYVTVTFNSPIDAETMETLCRSIVQEYHIDGYELHQEISDFYNTDVTIVYPSERIAA
jgi:c-di-AMP phosphodiesterase-like protein